jgi:hypothetical protein
MNDVTTTIQYLSPKRIATGAVVAVATFGILGTVSALWQNPIFIRMTPVGGFEITFLALLSFLSGVYVIIRRSLCSNNKVGVGGLLGFLGIACPICNKILVMAFGSQALLTYYEPIRIYVAAIGVVVTGWAVVYEWRRRGDVYAETPEDLIAFQD